MQCNVCMCVSGFVRSLLTYIMYDAWMHARMACMYACTHGAAWLYVRVYISVSLSVSIFAGKRWYTHIIVCIFTRDYTVKKQKRMRTVYFPWNVRNLVSERKCSQPNHTPRKAGHEKHLPWLPTCCYWIGTTLWKWPGKLQIQVHPSGIYKHISMLSCAHAKCTRMSSCVCVSAVWACFKQGRIVSKTWKMLTHPNETLRISLPHGSTEPSSLCQLFSSSPFTNMKLFSRKWIQTAVKKLLSNQYI